MNLCGVIDLQRSYFGHSALEYIIDYNQMNFGKADHEHEAYVEIVNGSSVLPNTIFDKIKDFSKQVKVQFGAKVVKVDDSFSASASVTYETSEGEKVIFGDQVILTPTARAVTLMDISPPLPYMKTLALDSLEYFGSVKIFLKFDSPFWAYSNKAPNIDYYSNSTINGATGVTDNLLKAVKKDDQLYLFQIISIRPTTHLMIFMDLFFWPPTHGKVMLTDGCRCLMTSVSKK